MTIRYDIDRKKNVIFMGAYGIISVADIAAAINEIELQLNFSDKMSMLIEVREIKRAFFVREMDRLIDLLANEAGRFVSRYAFVVSTDIVQGVGRRFPIKARLKGLELEVFKDYVSAASWLKVVA